MPASPLVYDGQGGRKATDKLPACDSGRSGPVGLSSRRTGRRALPHAINDELCRSGKGSLSLEAKGRGKPILACCLRRAHAVPSTKVVVERT